MNRNKLIRIASLFGVLAVILGAFGAHTLKTLLTPDQLQSYETGVRYQFYHTFAILICALLTDKVVSSKLNMAAGSFIAGILLFSGSIYMLSLKSLFGIESLSWLGPITPIGGVLFIVGWVFVFLSAKNETSK